MSTFKVSTSWLRSGWSASVIGSCFIVYSVSCRNCFGKGSSSHIPSLTSLGRWRLARRFRNDGLYQRWQEPNASFFFFFWTNLINWVVVSFLRGHELDLSIGGPGSHAAVSDLVLEQKWERFPEGLLKGGAHEAVNYGINRRVGVRHAVRPRLDLVGCVVGLIVCRERLEEDKDLDRTPADGEEEDDYDYHLGHFAPDADGSLRQEVDLKRRTVSLMSISNDWI